MSQHNDFEELSDIQIQRPTADMMQRIRDSEHSALNGIPPYRFFTWGSGSPVVKEVERVQAPASTEDAKVQHHLKQHDWCTGELTETETAFTKPTCLDQKGSENWKEKWTHAHHP